MAVTFLRKLSESYGTDFIDRYSSTNFSEFVDEEEYPELLKAIESYFGSKKGTIITIDFSWHPDESDYSRVFKKGASLVRLATTAVDKGRLIHKASSTDEEDLYEYEGCLVGYDRVEYYTIYKKR